MSKKITGKMQINLDNLIKILATALYSRDDVALREILSNSIDSLTRKKALAKEKDDDDYRIIIKTDQPKGVLSIKDTGVGMTREEIEKYIAGIGSSGTKAIHKEIKDPELLKQLIGQFGIGLLSAFTIADRVEIETKSIHSGPDDPGFVWACDGQEKYTLEEIPLDAHGTTTNLIINRSKLEVLQPEYIKEVVSTYGEFMPYPIFDQHKEQLNTVNAPWHKGEENIVVEDYFEYLQRKYGDKMDRPLAVHPLVYRSDKMDIGGVLYIPKGQDYFNHQFAADLYVRRVLVRRDCPHILPEWVTFIGGIIDCSGLSMVMSREDVVRGDSAFGQFRHILETQILSFIKEIKRDQRTLRSVLLTHGRELEIGCRMHKPLFDIIADEIFFQCGEELINLRTYVERADRREISEFRDRIFYSTVKDVQSQIQLSRLYHQQNLDIINARNEIDEFIIEAYANEGGLKLVNVDDEGASQFFSEEGGEQWKVLEEIFQLSDFPPFSPKVSHFAPIDVPAILIRQDLGAKNKKVLKKYLEEETLPQELREFLDSVKEKGPKDARILYINADNNVIQQLLKVAKSDFELAKSAAHEIYHNSLQFSGETLDSHRLQHIYDFHNTFLSEALLLHTKKEELKETAAINKNKDQEGITDIRSVFPDYNTKPRQVFIMMSFREEQKWIYSELMKGICKELELEIIRIDEVNVRARITDAIFQKIRESGVLFAIISDNNPNVLYELGLAHAYGKAWQTILLSNDTDQIPFDLKDYQVSKIPEKAEEVKKIYDNWKSIVKKIVDNVERAQKAD